MNAEEIRKALDAYRATGARELPSVKKSVPRAFKDAVDELVDAIEKAIK